MVLGYVLLAKEERSCSRIRHQPDEAAAGACKKMEKRATKEQSEKIDKSVNIFVSFSVLSNKLSITKLVDRFLFFQTSSQ